MRLCVVDGPRNELVAARNVDVAVGAKVREALALSGISVAQASERLDVTAELLNACLDGRLRFPVPLLHRISLMTDRSVLWFFDI